MKITFEEYLLAIGIKELFYARAMDVIDFYKKYFADSIDTIFVTDYVDEQGIRHYENLWLFNDRYFMEAKQFLLQDDFDITPFTKRVKYITIQKQNYDFIKATSKSRMTLRVSTAHLISGEFKSSQENCDYLRDIYNDYFKNNLLD